MEFIPSIKVSENIQNSTEEKVEVQQLKMKVTTQKSAKTEENQTKSTQK